MKYKIPLWGGFVLLALLVFVAILSQKIQQGATIREVDVTLYRQGEAIREVDVTLYPPQVQRIEQLWANASQEFREAVFNNSLATAGIMLSSTGEYLAREPLLDSNCQGEVLADRALNVRGNIPENEVRAIVRASACYTLTGRRG